MAKYYKTGYSKDTVLASPPVGPLLGGELAKRTRVESVMRAQDRVPALGRRIVLSSSLSGSQAFLVPNTAPGIGATRTHPEPSLARFCARARFTLTPGHMLRLSALVSPSGGTQVYKVETGGDGPNWPGPTQGQLLLNLYWYDAAGGHVATEHYIDLPSSSENGGTISVNGEWWKAVRVVQTSMLTPEDISQKDDLRDWCQQNTVVAFLSQVGGARVIDAVLHEVPYGLSLEASDPAGQWVGHQFADVAGKTPHPVLEWPYDRYDDSGPDGDPRQGTQHLLDVHHAQWDRLGPALIYWNAWQELTSEGLLVHTLGTNTSTTAYTEAYHFLGTFVTATTGVWYDFPNTLNTNGYDANYPGWDICAAAYSRRQDENTDELLPHNGSVPVVVLVKASSNSAIVEGTLRVQSSAYSYVDVRLVGLAASTTPTASFFVGYGHLRCGWGPGDFSNVQMFIRRTAATGSIRVFSVSVHRAPQSAMATFATQ